MGAVLTTRLLHNERTIPPQRRDRVAPAGSARLDENRRVFIVDSWQSGGWPQALASDLAVYIDRNSPIERTMLEFHIVSIEAAWPDTFEADRLQRAETVINASVCSTCGRATSANSGVT